MSLLNTALYRNVTFMFSLEVFLTIYAADPVMIHCIEVNVTV